jgi:esterase/lipase superfamily enzyme
LDGISHVAVNKPGLAGSPSEYLWGFQCPYIVIRLEQHKLIEQGFVLGVAAEME